jgi:hypothetical protein
MAAQDAKRAAEAAGIETEAEATARIHDMVQASLAAQQATYSRAAAEDAAASKTAESTAA